MLLSYSQLADGQQMQIYGHEIHEGASVKTNLPKIMLLVIAVISAIFLQWLAVPVVFLSYIILSLTTKKQLK